MDQAVIARVKAATKEENNADVPMPDVERLIRKSLLLNLGVVISALVIAASVGEPWGAMKLHGLSRSGTYGATDVAALALMLILLIWVFT